MSEVEQNVSDASSGVNRRLWILSLVVLVGFSVIWILPEGSYQAPSMLKRDLPEVLGEWLGRKGEISSEELRILAKDTTFSRKSYVKDGEMNLHAVEASIVFSGEDMNNSIHRPERCLKSQGWAFDSETYKEVDVELNGASYLLPFKEIVFRRYLYKRNNADERVKILAVDGKHAYVQRIQYYTFFGESVIVSGHYERTFHDVADRVLSAKTQQWAYATFSTQVTEVYKNQGLIASDVRTQSIGDARGALEGFISRLLPLMLKDEGVREISSLKK